MSHTIETETEIAIKAAAKPPAKAGTGAIIKSILRAHLKHKCSMIGLYRMYVAELDSLPLHKTFLLETRARDSAGGATIRAYLIHVRINPYNNLGAALKPMMARDERNYLRYYARSVNARPIFAMIMRKKMICRDVSTGRRVYRF